MNEHFDLTYKSLFRRYYTNLLFYATRIVGEEDAEDVVQDVFVELWKRKDTMKVGEQIQAFLYRAVYTRALNVLKHRDIVSGYEAVMLEIHKKRVEFYQPDSNDVVKRIEDAELRRKLSDVINELPDKCRMVFKLSYLHDMKNKEIADTMGVSLRTVEAHMYKALKLLRDKLGYLNLMLALFFHRESKCFCEQRCFIIIMKERMNKLNEEILAKFLMGECTEDELREVNAWLEESGENARELFRLEEIYHLGRLGDTSNTQDIEKAEKRLFKRLEQEKTKQYKVRRMVGWIRYAAVFVGFFLLGTFGYLFYQTYSQPETLLAVTTHDKIKELKLPDGTKVWLNKNTTLKYPHEFAGKGRKVYLEGEGYFEVMRNPEKPFVVQSEVMQVRVLGTVFNLKSDKAKMSAVATLLKGEVEVKGNHGEGMIILAPGQKAELNGMTRRLVVKQVDTGIENWHNNEFVFEKADLYTIARTLENSYGVRVILAPNIDVSKTYSGTLKKKESVGAVLNLIKNAIPLEYKIVGNSVFLSSMK